MARHSLTEARRSVMDLPASALQVLKSIVASLANKEIAYTLNIAEYTVNHVENMLDRLGVQDRTQAATGIQRRFEVGARLQTD
jgi:DNA-binding NarL/FixJ family response regulator